MGGTWSCVTNEKTDEIEKELRKDKENAKNELKILLLGTGESGKSTVLKQMRLIHGKGFLKEEMESFKDTIFVNVTQFMRKLVVGMNQLGIDLHNPDNTKELQYIMDTSTSNVLTPEIVTAVKRLWCDQNIQLAYTRRNEFQINETGKYFIDNLDRIVAKDYNPTNQDILYSRLQTCGITEHKVKVGDYIYRMVDVGGQRSQRRKWIHFFEGVTAVLFIAAISEYDQVLVEDNQTNRLVESMTLFDSICNHPYFKKSCMILFLNKQDLFEEKLKTSPLRPHLPMINDTINLSDATEAKRAIQSLFMAYAGPDCPTVYPHFTCATDTNQIGFVMSSVTVTIIQNNVQSAGILISPVMKSLL